MPLNYRHTNIDIFVGGPADGKLTSMRTDRDSVVMMNPPPPTPLSAYDENEGPHDFPRFSTTSYRRERMRAQNGDTIADVSFWIAEGMTVEKALIKLCLGYKPETVPQEQPA